MKEGFEPKAYKLMTKSGYDFTAHAKFKSLKIYEHPEFSLTQKKLLWEEHYISCQEKDFDTSH